MPRPPGVGGYSESLTAGCVSAASYGCITDEPRPFKFLIRIEFSVWSESVTPRPRRGLPPTSGQGCRAQCPTFPVT